MVNKSRLLGSLIGIAGFVLLVVALGWAVGIGVLLMIWGNNIERFM